MSTAAARILMTADAVGGVWQYSLDLARGLAGRGTHTMLAVMGPAPTSAQRRIAEGIEGLELIETGLPLDWLASSRASIRKAGDAIAALAERQGADLVQLNAPALAAETDFGRPTVAVSHSCLATWWQAVKSGHPPAAFGWRGAMTGAGLRAADAAVAPSRAFAEATMGAHGLDRLPHVVHNGRAPLTLPKVAPHDFAFTAGRLWDEGKNVATLDRAAARLAIPFHMAGSTDGPGGAAIRLTHAHALGNLSEPQLARWLARRPVFASAALYEPFGLAVLEAAAAGCPLVLSDIPTFRELWDGAAIFVDPADDAGFAAAISALAGDDFARARSGKAAQEQAARYTPAAMAARMAAIHAAAMAPEGAKAAA